MIKPKALSRILFVATCLLGLALVVVAPKMGTWLVISKPLRPCDYILVLGGDVEIRPLVAAWAYHQGLGKAVLFSQPKDRFVPEVPFDVPERDLIPAILRKAGVPPEALVPLPGEVDGTLGEGEMLNKYLKENGGNSVLVVTTNWHTRRAGWILQKKVGGRATIEMLPAPCAGFSPESWWKSPSGLEMITAEYLKIIWYWLRG